MTGYEFADQLAKSLGIDDGFSQADADQITNYVRPLVDIVSDPIDQRAETLVCYLLGVADVSPSSVSQYVDMIVQQASSLPEDEEQWTTLQLGEEMARILSKSQLTESEAWQIFDNTDVVGMRAEAFAIPIAAYLCGRANRGTGELSQCISKVFDL